MSGSDKSVTLFTENFFNGCRDRVVSISMAEQHILLSYMENLSARAVLYEF